ncbi:MAG TPA: hypothetical protein DC006_02210, partial [Prevotellaceae bacterium]|nr:hypothetical protein [Prevotellaceae bacterium]
LEAGTRLVTTLALGTRLVAALALEAGTRLVATLALGAWLVTALAGRSRLIGSGLRGAGCVAAICRTADARTQDTPICSCFSLARVVFTIGRTIALVARPFCAFGELLLPAFVFNTHSVFSAFAFLQ